MTTYKFIAEYDDVFGKPSGHRVMTEFKADHIDTVLENFELFLRGVGFQTEGTLDFISEDEYYGDGHEGMGSTLEDYPELNETPSPLVDEWTRIRREDARAEGAELHSKYYYDTERNK